MFGEELRDRINSSAVENFRKYLQIPSVQPNVNYDECVEFLRKQASEVGLDFAVFEPVKSKPIVVMSWKGKEPSLGSILLNSHMDVVPVFPEFWRHGPFDAEMDENGNIYGRGAQDMKCVAIQYLEALKRIISSGKKLKRTVHLSFVPDEEIGGVDGMKKFVKTKEFRDLNVCFALDEGHSSPTDTLLVFNTERNIWLIYPEEIEFICSGSEGHGSILLKNTAGEKMSKLLGKIMEFRESQVKRLNSNAKLSMGDVTTVNLTMMKGGIEPNVVPPELSATFDFRLAPDVDQGDFEEQINRWTAEAGGDIRINWIQKNMRVPATKVDDSNPFWMKMKKELEEMNIKFRMSTFPGGTDGKYCREMGIPVIGFSPIMNTPILLHANDEFLNREIFLRGIEVYERVIPAIANVD